MSLCKRLSTKDTKWHKGRKWEEWGLGEDGEKRVSTKNAKGARRKKEKGDN